MAEFSKTHDLISQAIEEVTHLTFINKHTLDVSSDAPMTKTQMLIKDAIEPMIKTTNETSPDLWTSLGFLSILLLLWFVFKK